MYRIKAFLALSLLLCFKSDAFAKKIYKWVDQQGHVYFTEEQPPAEASKVSEFGKEGTPDASAETKAVNVPDLELLEIKTKFIERSGDYVSFSIRVKVRCTDPNFRGKAQVRLRSLDGKGLESDTETATGKISSTTAVLSDKCMMKYKFYKQITKWEVVDIDLEQG